MNTVTTSSQSFQSKKIATWISLGAGILILGAKFYAYYLTDSKAVLSDALESIVNVLTAFVALVVIRISSKPADPEHPYGHGKAEYFSAAFEGGLIAFAAVLIIVEAVQTVFHRHPLQQLDYGILVILAAALANAALGIFLIRRGRKNQSITLVASGRHVMTNFWTSMGATIALVLVKTTDIFWFDPFFAFLIGLHLSATGWKLVRESVGGLMDEEDRGLIQQVADLFEKHYRPGIIRIHHTRIMRSGAYHHIDAHVVVPEFWDVETSHVETSKFEHAVITDYHVDGEIHFHLDPCRRVYCKICDYPDCPVRSVPFEARIPLKIEELISPVETEL